MAKFRFKLQSVLDLKIQLEDSLKDELGKALQKLEAQKNELAKLDSAKEANIEDFNRNVAMGISVENLKRQQAYISYIRTKIIVQKENVNSARLSVDKVRGELIKIMQEREMLDKLKEKKHQAFLEEQLRAEQRLNDEIVSFRQSSAMAGG